MMFSKLNSSTCLNVCQIIQYCFVNIYLISFPKSFFFFLHHSELKKVYMLEMCSFLKGCAVEFLFQYVIDPADVSFGKKRVHGWFLGITAFF